MARRTATSADGDGSAEAPEADPTPEGYTVVARRYRPQRFEDVVGQDHVVGALRNAIRLNRVTHAYLFCGTRGVGKTSMARIFAKCLNCERGPTEEPCLRCDICQAIAAGQDVDVIEIDGASNNGVEAVRELRQNAGLRPSRARFKIYYIDEVHMLSTGAFNALLKTLEEPPEHVKFFFATTEANKIPITVLSRCQRYDFAGIAPEQIVATLAEICAAEHVEVDRDALQVVARRASGSMRDAQSLLEQLLSSGARRLTAEAVHQLLGIAADERVLDLLDALADRDPARALTLVDGALASGVQPVDLLGGLLEFLRDTMVLAAGAEVLPLAASPGQRPRLQAVAARWSLDSILAAQQILAEARGRLRGSPHGRLLVELALCRVCRLESFAELGELVARLSALEAGPPALANPVKKKSDPPENRLASPGPSPHARTEAEDLAPSPTGRASPPPADALTLDALHAAWPEVVARLGAELGTKLNRVRPTAILGPNSLAIGVPPGYNWVADACDTTEGRARIEAALRGVLRRPLAVEFQRAQAEPGSAPVAGPGPTGPDDDLAGDPMVQKVIELFEARRVPIRNED